jgi:hypothetical protein
MAPATKLTAATTASVVNGLVAVASRTTLVASAHSCCALPESSLAFPCQWRRGVPDQRGGRALNLAGYFLNRTFHLFRVHFDAPWLSCARGT